jgi:hypothetical protein
VRRREESDNRPELSSQDRAAIIHSTKAKGYRRTFICLPNRYLPMRTPTDDVVAARAITTHIMVDSFEQQEMIFSFLRCVYPRVVRPCTCEGEDPAICQGSKNNRRAAEAI